MPTNPKGNFSHGQHFIIPSFLLTVYSFTKCFFILFYFIFLWSRCKSNFRFRNILLTPASALMLYVITNSLFAMARPSHFYIVPYLISFFCTYIHSSHIIIRGWGGWREKNVFMYKSNIKYESSIKNCINAIKFATKSE
jgi:hypothetical protein